MGIMTEYHNLPTRELIENLRHFQLVNEKNGCIPNGLLEEIIQRLEMLEGSIRGRYR